MLQAGLPDGLRFVDFPRDSASDQLIADQWPSIVVTGQQYQPADDALVAPPSGHSRRGGIMVFQTPTTAAAHRNMAALSTKGT